MRFSRREFLKNSSLGVLSGLAFLQSPFAFAESLSFTHDLVAGVRKKDSNGFVIRRTDFATGKMQDLDISFEPHAFVQHPQLPERVWVIENFGGNAAEIDYRAGKIVQEIKLPAGE